MKKFLAVMLITVLAVSGCGRKADQKKEEALTPGRKLLIEGTVFLKQGDVARAVQAFATSIKIEPNEFEGYYLLSETLIRLQQFPQAEAILMAAASRFPDNGVVYYLLSLAQQSQEKLVPAIISARKSVDLLTARNDKEGQQRAMILLAALINEAKSASEAEAVRNAAKAAGQVVEQAVSGDEAKVPQKP